MALHSYRFKGADRKQFDAAMKARGAHWSSHLPAGPHLADGQEYPDFVIEVGDDFVADVVAVMNTLEVAASEERIIHR